jgi:dissimilatory sulfite reductase (desulfoviridin) alpha/beta subunit
MCTSISLRIFAQVCTNDCVQTHIDVDFSVLTAEAMKLSVLLCVVQSDRLLLKFQRQLVHPFRVNLWLPKRR